LRADGGYFNAADSSYATYLAHVRLRHDLNPLTFEQFEYYRSLTEPSRSIVDVYSYSLQHTFRENLYGEFDGSIATFTDPSNRGQSGEERRAHLRFSYAVGAKMTWSLSGAYLNSHNDNPVYGDAVQWTGRSAIHYNYTPSLQFRLYYQFSDRWSSVAEGSFRENMVMLTMTKHF
jgi:hypothetical protein